MEEEFPFKVRLNKKYKCRKKYWRRDGVAVRESRDKTCYGVILYGTVTIQLFYKGFLDKITA
jgi:hypothetical protein